MISGFAVGQRWASETEPTLGLGLVTRVEHRNIAVKFPATGESRIYRVQNAPLKRVQFEPGDEVSDEMGDLHKITSVAREGALLRYQCGEVTLPEEQLGAGRVFSRPEDRLLSDRPAHVREFNLRKKALKHLHIYQSSPVKGLLGGRIDLLHHQIYIAHTVAARSVPRTLLADEVGLGKTIEAGLIFHNLFVTGKRNRTLILCPDALINQWLVELYRKFNHMFTIMDQDAYQFSKNISPEQNPFQELQNAICPLSLFQSQPESFLEAKVSNWDLVIVDEAHHLEWDPSNPLPAYQMVENLLSAETALLLLTATPLQLGEANHFGRLRLLDPQRYQSFAEFQSEAKNYHSVVALAHDALDNPDVPPDFSQKVAKIFPGDASLRELALKAEANHPGARDYFIQSLVDRYGTGRMVFRNRRSVIKGFPSRRLVPVPLKAGEKFQQSWNLLKPFLRWDESILKLDPLAFTPAHFKLPQEESAMPLKNLWMQDPRIDWLVGFLKKFPKSEKILLICSSRGKVLNLQNTLPHVTKATFTCFHEDLPLNIRDKNAADFSRDSGVQLMISSEIGSEGRNFQFSHKLILWDLPLNPELLEQRIGRLHRIGQKNTIEIYVPFVQGSPKELLFYWYHRGLKAFDEPLAGTESIFADFRDRLESLGRGQFEDSQNLLEEFSPFSQILQETIQARDRLYQWTESNRNKLLELNSLQHDISENLISQIKSMDEAPDLENFLDDVFDVYGIQFTPTVEKRGYQIFPGSEMTLDAFPGLLESGVNATFDRDTALVREDMTFLSWDHPMVRGALDLILGSTENTSCICEWKKAPLQGLLLEVIFILEPLEDAGVHMEDIMAPTPLTTLVDLEGRDASAHLPDLEESHLHRCQLPGGEEKKQLKESLLPFMIKAARKQAEIEAYKIREISLHHFAEKIKREQERADFLALANSGSHLALRNSSKEWKGILEKIRRSELRMDSLRLIVCQP